ALLSFLRRLSRLTAYFLFHSYSRFRYPRSFPTRRSSDLVKEDGVSIPCSSANPRAAAALPLRHREAPSTRPVSTPSTTSSGVNSRLSTPSASAAASNW